MNLHDILLPVFVLVALIFALMILMAVRRLRAVKSGEVQGDQVSMGEKAWPAPAQRASNAFSNHFELPVLFFALVPLAIFTKKADFLFVVLSWIFVLARIVQAGAYVTTNHLPTRFTSYLVGALALMAMWLIFAIRILGTPLPA